MLIAAARTHVGRVRTQNEDAAVCRADEGLLAVIDGMGGQEAGEVAAAIAAQALGEVSNNRGLASEAVLAQALREARTRILRAGAENSAQRDMGAVATAVRLDDDGRHFSIAHAGDTRAWLVTASGAHQLTRDHVERQAEGKPQVSRDLGRKNMPDDWVETSRHAVNPGDVLILASDGLYDPVPEPELAKVFQAIRKERTAPEAACGKLVSLALLHGGPDNVTVVVARLGSFRRGARRRLGPAVSAVLFVALAALAAIALVRPDPRATPPPTSAVPDRVEQSVMLDADSIDAPAGKTTVVDASTTLSLRGVHLTAPDWTVQVGPDATLRITRSVIEIGGALHVQLAANASLVIEDTRIDAGEVRVTGAGGSRVRLAHASVEAATEPAFEGQVTRLDETDVRVRARPEPAVEPASPPADATSAPEGTTSAPPAPRGGPGTPPSRSP
jgi:serine/threonine protein phosphatase PrpC